MFSKHVLLVLSYTVYMGVRMESPLIQFMATYRTPGTPNPLKKLPNIPILRLAQIIGEGRQLFGPAL